MSLTMMCFIYTLHAQAPTLGATANFAVFSSNGAVSDTGSALITGDVGTNAGLLSGFGNVDGVMHPGPNATTLAAAGSLTVLYNELNAAIANMPEPAPVLGNGATYTPGVYSIGQAASINGTMILDGGGNPNALFIFKIQGALSTSANAQVVLINNALACNVFWKVEPTGVTMGTNTIMKGTIVANGAIVLNTGVNLEGRALSTVGAISVLGATITKPLGCGATVLTGPVVPPLNTVSCFALFTASGAIGNTGVSSVTGDIGFAAIGPVAGFETSTVNGTIHTTADTTTALAATELNVVYTYITGLPTDIQLLYPAAFGNGLVLTPHTYHLNGATALTGNVYLNAQGNPNAVFVIKINGALTTSVGAAVILQNGAQAKNVFWHVTGGSITLNSNTSFRGTLMGNAAVSLASGVMVEGSVLTTSGAIATSSVNVQMTPGCGVLATGSSTIVNLGAKLYPNPFSSVLNVTLDGVDNGSSLKLYNAAGSKVLDVRLSNKTTSLPINLPAGVYFYQLTGKNGEQQGGKLISKP